MTIIEQIAIMKHEARLANRAEGLKNWTDEARAKSLATRRARGSVWGWNNRPRAAASTGSAFDRSMEAMTEDAETVRRSLASQKAGVPVISAPSEGAEEIAAKRLEAFMSWLAEVKRVEGAIDDFNGTVAALGGLTSGVAKSQRGQSIGPEYADPAAEAAARKAAIEKSIRRNFEKRNADYLRKNPDERGVMLDMVAEKAEYYSAEPSRKVEIEKDAYRRIRDSGTSEVRENSGSKKYSYDREAYLKWVKTITPEEWSAAVQQKRAAVREREAVRAQLQPGEEAYPAGNGIWIGRLPGGDERVISAIPEPFALPLKKPAPSSKAQEKLIDDREWTDTLQDGRSLIGGRYYDRIGNRHTPSCAASQSPGGECNCSCGGSRHGTQASGSAPNGNGKSMKDYIADGFSNLDPDWAAKAVRRIEERESWGKKITAAEKRFLDDYNAYVEEMNKKGGDGKEPAARVIESGVMTSNGPVKLSGTSEPEESAQWDNLVSGFKTLIGNGSKPTLRNLQNQLSKDHDEKKFKLASAALAEAYNADSLDKFQDKFARDPNNNFEFRTFQRKIGVPPEFIGDK